MNFLDLYKKISHLDEGASQGNMMPQAVSAPPSAPVTECGGMGECGMGPEPTKQQDSVSMSVNMNASSVGGIRDLMNVLQNLEQSIGADDSHDVMVSKASDKPMDVNISAVEELPPPEMPEPAMPDPQSLAQTAAVEEPTMPTDDELISDEIDDETDYANDPEIRKMSVASVMGTGDDLASKGKEAPKQAGGGNPWNVSESKIAAKLMQHYQEVKNRPISESDWKPVQYGYGDPQTWGGRHYDNSDDEINAWGIERDIDDAELDLPPELESKLPSNMFAFTYEFNHEHDLELHKVMVYDEKVDDFIDVTKYASVLKQPIWSWIQKYDLDNYTKAYIDAHQDDGDYGYNDDDYY